MRPPAACATLLVAALLAAGCDGEEQTYGDQRIADALGLERIDSGLAIDADPFCMVSEELLGDSEAVEAARDDDELGLVVASREGNVGVRGEPPFARDCRRRAKQRLDRLDPPPRE